MRCMNTVTLVGRLGRDPELRTTRNGKVVASMSVATSRSRKVDDGWIEMTEWHKVIAWEKTAERAARDLKKGSPVVVGGELRYNSWVDDQGVKRHKAEIWANDLSYLGVAPAPQPAMAQEAAPEEIPF